MRIFAKLGGYQSMKKAAVFIIGGASLFSSAGVVRAASLSPSCALPDQLLSLSGTLTQTLRHVSEDNKLNVIAIGSSSTAGAGASSADHTYPMRFKREMELRFPHLKLSVENLGINGEVASSTIERLHKEVALRKPDLVIWQLGTNDAVRGVSNASFRTQVLQTIDWLQQNDVEVVLMNPQYYPKIQNDTAYAAVVEDLRQMASREEVPMINRFAAMQHWGGLPEDVRQHMLWTDNFHMNDAGYACVGQMVAESIYRRSTTEAQAKIAGTAPSGAIKQQTSAAQ